MNEQAKKEARPTAVRADKDLVVSLVARSTPDFLEILTDCKDAAAWRKFSDKLTERRTRMSVNDYHVLYEDEKRIGYILLRAVMPHEYIKTYSDKFIEASPEEQQEFLRDLAKAGGLGEQLADNMFPDNEELLKEQVAELEQMEEGPEKQEIIRRGQYLLAFLLSWFHEVMAVMVHGEKMTSLVPKALAGDRDAFLQARGE